MRSLVKHKSLIGQLVWRDLSARYRNSMLGALWLLIQPLLQLAVYSFVFQMVLRARWDVVTEAGAQVPFGIVLFAGLLLHAVIADALTRGPSLVTSNPTFVKRVIFPLETLPIVSVISALVLLLLSLVLLAIVTFILVGPLPIAGLLAIVPVLLLGAIGLGLAWLMAGLGVYVPDLSQFTPLLATLLLFTAPVCYPKGMVPEQYQWLLWLNPLTVPVENTRSLLFTGVADWAQIGLYGVVAVLVLVLGGVAFKKMRGGFADVI